MWPPEGAAHSENVLIISNVDQLTDWNPLVHFSTGSSMCVYVRCTSYFVFILPTSAGLTGCAETLEGLAATTGETCH